MRCHAYADIAEFATTVLPWLAREPVLNNVLSTVVNARANGSSEPAAEGAWLVVLDRGELAGVATVTPPGGALLSVMQPAAAKAVAEHLCGPMGGTLPFVVGPIEAAAAFAEWFGHHSGRRPFVTMNLRVFELKAVIAPPYVPGLARAATAADRDLLVAWSAIFHRDATPNQPAPDPAAGIDSRFRASTADLPLLWLWEVDGEPVSMCWLTPELAGVTRVGGVYTPPDYRGRGYASANVAAASRHALDHGVGTCMLNTDLSNPTSNKIYQAIGYRPVGDWQEWSFS